jgi:hypothetical protein
MFGELLEDYREEEGERYLKYQAEIIKYSFNKKRPLEKK